MKYRIKITYQTGNSFNSYIEEDYIPYEWSDLSKIEKALQSIAAHHNAVDELDGARNKERIAVINKYKNEPWFVPSQYTDNDFTYTVQLELDDGTMQEFNAYWHGYFERLESIEITIDKSAWKIDF